MRHGVGSAVLGGGMLICCAPSGGAPFPTPPSLVGSGWAPADLRGAPRPGASKGKATLAFFAPGKVSGNGSCNRFTGSLELGDLGVVKIGPLASTRMACPGLLGNQETAYLAALEKAERLGLDGDKLVIYSQG